MASARMGSNPIDSPSRRVNVMSHCLIQSIPTKPPSSSAGLLMRRFASWYVERVGWAFRVDLELCPDKGHGCTCTLGYIVPPLLFVLRFGSYSCPQSEAQLAPICPQWQGCPRTLSMTTNLKKAFHYFSYRNTTCEKTWSRQYFRPRDG
jgi:hypothetical protein